MDKKVIVVSAVKNNLTESITYCLDQACLDFKIIPHVSDLLSVDEIEVIILVNNLDTSAIIDFSSQHKIKLLVISSRQVDLRSCNAVNNVIITPLVEDIKKYTRTQKEYLFKKGIYSVINGFINRFIANDDLLIDGLIIDMSESKTEPEDWVFEFSSLNESYYWLSRHNRTQDPNIELRIINFVLDRLYDDSDKEIRYLIDRINDIKSGQKSSDIFVCTSEELERYRKNLFFRNLVNNISKNYKIYLVDKDLLKDSYPELLEKITHGVIIYDDCIYRDYLDNEISLGFVDCRAEKVAEYLRYYDLLLNKLSIEIKKEADLNEFCK